MKVSERQKKAQDQAYSRLLDRLEQEAEFDQKVEESAAMIEKQRVREDERVRREQQARLKEHNRLLQKQLEEQRRTKAQQKVQRKSDWIDPGFHGYPNRPETPPNIRRSNELIQQQNFRVQLDGQLQQHHEVLNAQTQAEQEETAALVHQYRLNILEDENAKKQRREQEKAIYRDGLSQVKQARRYADTVREETLKPVIMPQKRSPRAKPKLLPQRRSKEGQQGLLQGAQEIPRQILVKSKSQQVLQSQVFPLNKQRTPPEIRQRRSRRARQAIQNQIARLRDRNYSESPKLSPIKAQIGVKSRKLAQQSSQDAGLNNKQRMFLAQRSEQLRRSIEEQLLELKEIQHLTQAHAKRASLPDAHNLAH